MAIVRELVTKLGFKTDSAGFKKADQQIAQLKTSFLKLGAVTSAVIGGLAIPAAALERTLKDAVIASGATGKAFGDLEESLRQDALNLSDKLGTSGREVAKSFFDVISTGTKAGTRDFQTLSETGLKFAKAAGVESGFAIDRLATASKNFFGNVSQATDVANVFFKANTLGQTTVAGLIEAMRDAGPAAAQAGIPLAETAAVLTTLADAGFKGALAGTAFRQITTKLLAPTGEAAKTLKDLGVNAFDPVTKKTRNIIDVFRDLQKALKGQTKEQQQSTLKTLAGEEAFSRLGAILNRNLDQMESWRDQLKNSGGTLDEAFNQVMNSTSEQTGQLGVSIKNLAASFGKPLLAPITAIIKGLNFLISGFRSFAERNKTLVSILVLFISTFLTVATLVTGARLGFLLLGKAIGFVNLGLVAFVAKWVAIAFVLAGVFLIFEDLAQFLLGQNSVIGNLVGSYKNWRRELQQTSPILGAMANIVESLGEALMAIPRAIVNITSAFANFLSGDTQKALDAINNIGFLGDLGKKIGSMAFDLFGGGQPSSEPIRGQAPQMNVNMGGMVVNTPNNVPPEEAQKAIQQATERVMSRQLRQSFSELETQMVQ